MAAIVFDSSSLISLSQSCLIKAVKGLAESGNASFAVPQSVFFEAVQRPLQIKRFELNALRLKKAVQDNWISVEKLDSEHAGLTKEIEETANSMFYLNGRAIRLIQRGEAEALALTKQLSSKLLVIDERTTRTIIENPTQLKAIIERRRHKRVKMDGKKANRLREIFSGLSMARSVEIIALAFEKGLLEEELPKGKQALEASLYAVKFAGCAVSGMEIEKFLRERK